MKKILIVSFLYCDNENTYKIKDQNFVGTTNNDIKNNSIKELSFYKYSIKDINNLKETKKKESESESQFLLEKDYWKNCKIVVKDIK